MPAVMVKFPLPPDEHRALKARAALSGLTLREFCRRLAKSALSTAPAPHDQNDSERALEAPDTVGRLSN